MMGRPPEDEFLTEEEAAAFLGMTKRMLRLRRHAGKIKCVKDGRYIMYSRASLLEYRNAYQRGGPVFTEEDLDPETIMRALGKHLKRDTRQRSPKQKRD